MRFITLSILILALIAVSSCAEQLTVREREMKKYEKIDTDLVRGMPDSIVKTIDAYNDGDYYLAAIGFYAIMKNPEWARLHETARYYYAESLFRVGLFQPAEYQLAEILFEGPDNHYFVSSLLKLLAVTYEIDDERVLFAVLSNVDYASLPKKFASELMYYLGKINFYKGNDDDAIKYFSQVKDYSSFYPSAMYFLGVIQVRKAMYAEAMQSFTKIKEMSDDQYVGADMKKIKGMAELALGELYYAAAFDKNTKNPLAMLNVALNYFSEVDHNNAQWFEALFAKAWASVMISRYDATLGTVVTLQSPFFTDVYFPELNVVEAVAYYNLCRYREVNDIIDNFTKVYPPYRDQMAAYLENVSTRTGLDVYKDILGMYVETQKGKQAALPEAVLRTLLTGPQFTRLYLHIKEVEKELGIIENSPEMFKKSIIAADLNKKLLTQLANLRNEAGKHLVKHLSEMKGDLTQVIADMKAIRFEMTDKLKAMYEKEEMFGKQMEAAQKKETDTYNPSVPPRYEYWPFDGEYWEDELGYYYYNAQSMCTGNE